MNGTLFWSNHTKTANSSTRVSPKLRPGADVYILWYCCCYHKVTNAYCVLSASSSYVLDQRLIRALNMWTHQNA